MFLNPIKLQRAIATLGQGASPEAIKAEYIRIGGRLEGDAKPEPVETPEVFDMPVVEPVIEEEKPKEKIVTVSKKKPTKKKK